METVAGAGRTLNALSVLEVTMRDGNSKNFVIISIPFPF